LKVLFIGLGGIGQRHLRNLISIKGKNIEIFALRTIKQNAEVSNTLSLEKGSNIEKKYNIKKINRLNEIKFLKPDLTFICNPSSHHIKSALVAASYGSHVFIEKPLSNSLNGIKKLKKIIKKNKKHIYIGYQLRFNPVLNKMKNMLDKNIIGNILGVRAEVAEYMPGFHKYEDYRKSYAALKKLGGGVILTQIHEIDYLQWIFGRPKNIYALGGKFSHLDIDVEDTASLVMDCTKKNKIIPVNLYMDYLQKNNRRSCIVYGSKGRIEADLKNLTINVIKNDSKIKEYSWKGFERNNQFINQLKHFLKVTYNKESSMVDLDEGLVSLKIALAAKSSLKSGKAIKVKY